MDPVCMKNNLKIKKTKISWTVCGVPNVCLYTRYPIVARALGLAFRPSASRKQRYLAYKSCAEYAWTVHIPCSVCVSTARYKYQLVLIIYLG